MDAELTPWLQDHYTHSTCHAMGCYYRATFHRYITLDGQDFLQQACAKHAGEENNFCPHCGHYLADKQVCPKCHRGKEEQVDAE